MIKIRPYEEQYFSEFLDFCKSETNSDDIASENMWSNNWENDTKTVLYLLKNNIRFNKKSGEFYILFDDDKIIGCSGVYVSDFSEKVALLGVRTWITKLYRNKHLVREYLLPAQKSWAISNSVDIVACSFNEYNKNLTSLFQRGQKYKTRDSHHMFYKNFNTLEYPVLIQSVPQWVIFENLTEYRFNWETIKA